MRGIFSGGLCFFLLTSSVSAVQFNPLYRGARAQAMGNAFVAVADDEQAIFYNPAGLAGVKTLAVNPFSSNTEVSEDAISYFPNLVGIFGNPSLASLNGLVGKNLYVKEQLSASVMIPYFGIAALYDYQAALRFRNQALPQGEFGIQNTYGIQAAFGMKIGRLKKKKGEFRIGFAGKSLWRSGGYKTPTLTEIMTLDASKLTSGMTTIGGGYGGDIGLQYIRPLTKRKLVLMTGVAMTDIGSTRFSNGAAPIESNLTGGVALRLTNADMVATLAADYAHILNFMDWRKKTHMGLELQFPVISLSGGLSQLQVTYGLSLDLPLIKVMYTSYAEEQMTLPGQDPERRHLVHFSFSLRL